MHIDQLRVRQHPEKNLLVALDGEVEGEECRALACKAATTPIDRPRVGTTGPECARQAGAPGEDLDDEGPVQGRQVETFALQAPIRSVKPWSGGICGRRVLRFGWVIGCIRVRMSRRMM